MATSNAGGVAATQELREDFVTIDRAAERLAANPSKAGMRPIKPWAPGAILYRFVCL